MRHHEKAIRRLLEHDSAAFAHMIGLSKQPPCISDAEAAGLLNLAEQYSRQPDDQAHDRCLLLAGLLWEHRHPHWAGVPSFLSILLSRIGMVPSIGMLTASHQGDPYQYPAIGSIFSEISVAARVAEREVLLGDTPLALSDFQYRLWAALDGAARIGVSAPTSAGKSFLLVNYAAHLLLGGARLIVFVVPTLSLIRQVSRDMQKEINRHSLNVTVAQSVGRTDNKSGDALVYVLTQERALSALGDPNALREADLVVVDEVQNIERMGDEDDERARILLDVIEEIHLARSPKKMAISGPRLDNIKELTQRLLGTSAVAVSDQVPPVVNLTYAFSSKGNTMYLQQYSTTSEVPLEVRIDQFPPGWNRLVGKQQYGDDAIGTITHLANHLIGYGATLVFSPTSSQATKTALELSHGLTYRETSESLISLSDYLERTVHPHYALASCVKRGVGYHHGKMPQHARLAVETAFSAGDLKLLACTTTLLQGVNLPAKFIIARNPHLFVRKTKKAASLTGYEFANLRGRAGRLLKDFVGRTLILDPAMFAEEQIEFDFPGKRVASGYEERFDRDRPNIVDVLTTGSAPDSAMQSADLVAYIRHVFMRDPHTARARLNRVGIRLDDREASAVQQQISSLSIPSHFCAVLPYWDPVVLDRLYKAYTYGRIPDLPATPYSPSFVNTLEECLAGIRTHAFSYYNRLFNRVRDDSIRSIAISAQNWVQEEPLSQLIRWGDDPIMNWEQVDRRLENVTRHIVYTLPKLLRPLAVFGTKDNGLLGMVESGGSTAATLALVSAGLPREIAVAAARFADKGRFEGLDGAKARRAAVEFGLGIKNRLGTWERLIIEDLFAPGL